MVNTRSTKDAPTTTGLETDPGTASAPINLGQPASPTDPYNESTRTIVDNRRPADQRSTTTTRTRRTTSSATARRRRDIEIEAAEKLAALKRDRINQVADIEEDLVRQKLQAQLQAIESDEGESDDAGSHNNEDTTRRRTEQWVRESAPHPTALTSPLPPAGPTREKARENTTRLETVQETPPLPQCSNGGMVYYKRLDPLPKFDGKAGDWLPFKATYDEQSHHFSRLENLARLRRSLAGEAKTMVCHQLIGRGDPDEVMDTLNSMYGRPEQIVAIEMAAIRRLPKMTDVKKQINVFTTQVRNTIAVLRAIDREEHLRNQNLVEIIKLKMEILMPRYLDYDELRLDSVPEIVKLRDFLIKESAKISKSWQIELENVPAHSTHVPTQPRATTTRGAGGAGTGGANNARQSKHTTLTTTSTDAAPATKPNCCSLCDSTDHNVSNCSKFKRATQDEKWEHVRAAQLCFRCLKRGHRSLVCRASKGCAIESCGRRHHTLLHDAERPTRPTVSTQAAAHTVMDGNNVEIATCGRANDRAQLKIVPVTLHGPRGDTKTYALLDDGSTVTLIDEELARNIGVVGPRSPMTLAGLNSTRSEPDSQRVSFDITGTIGGKHRVYDARTTSRLDLAAQSAGKIDGMEHLRGLPIEPYTDAKPQLLIGQDNWHLLVTSDMRRSKLNEPVASLTPLGWVLHGRGSGGSRRRGNCVMQINHIVTHTSAADRNITTLVEKHYKIDSLGVSTKTRQSTSDKRALAILEQTCRKENGRWEAGLLWNDDFVHMPPSYNSALKRLRSLEKKMDSDREFGEAYERQMNRLIDAGYATVSQPTESVKKWFLPHFAVTNVNKPGKIRIVFDAAARVNGRSLNDVLLTGPDLLQSLLGVLYKFREGKIAVSADIAEMFLRVSITPEDRPAQRFLWRGWDRTTAPKEFEMTSMIFGAASSPTTAIYVKNNSDTRDYKAFVSHRLAEIDDLSSPDQWRWVPTADNVADDATRNLLKLDENHRWFHGPEFLQYEEEAWPAQPTDIPRGEIELRSSEQVFATTTRTHCALPDPARFSRWARLRCAAAYVLLFIEKCRRRHTGGLERRHLDMAEVALLRQTQEDAFGAELNCLRAKHPLPRGSRLHVLSPYIDDTGAMRLRGRASATPGIERRTTEPIILCGRHHVTRLLVLHYHIASHHSHNEAVINHLRERYWIINLRPTVRTVARECQVCRIRMVTTMAPPMGDLPAARLSHHHRPFTHCGVDYFGPIDVAVGRRREKRYCALFTCLVTRAVHLEVAASLTTDSAINALRRMIARRGAPATIYSDNGTNFHGADAELQRAWAELDVDSIRAFALTKGADWRFIPPAAPFMGGAWERLVGTVRRALRATLHQRAPTDEVLSTLLAEAEMTVNARPLTHVSVDPADPEALTPNHFLLGSASGAPTPGAFDDSDLVRRRQWRAAQRLADIFWARWLKEYLPTLLPRRLPSDDRPELRPGDLVVIADPTLPRNVWPRGVVERVLPGRDGHVRVADVRTKGGVLRRPARKIARLPVQRVVEDQSTTGGRMSTTADK